MARKAITREELEEILRKHKLWLENDPEGERANLQGADLHGANLWGVDLRKADLYEVNFQRANLYRADLRGANLFRANLFKANLLGADLREADLPGAINVYCPIICPEEGAFTAFKKANNYIIKLEIPKDAARSSATTRKCRCSKAKVLSITNLDGSATDVTSIPSSYNENFIYTIGKTVEVSDFDTNRWNECAPGIHFFITRQEAVDYNRF